VIAQHAATPLSRHCAGGVSCDSDWAAPLCIRRRVFIPDCRREATVELQEQTRTFTRVVEELHALPAGVGTEASAAVTIRVFVSAALRGGRVAAVALREVTRAAAPTFQVPHAGVLARTPADVVSDYGVGLAADGVRLHVCRYWPEAIRTIAWVVHLTLLDQNVVVPSVEVDAVRPRAPRNQPPHTNIAAACVPRRTPRPCVGKPTSGGAQRPPRATAG
jgi:hypothetical protein